MLAWVHQAIAAEREFLEALLSIDTGSRMPGAVRAPAHAEDEWLGELMDAAVAGLCGPLRARVLQTVRAQESGLYAYKVSRLLHFYALTMARTLGSRALLATTLKEYVVSKKILLIQKRKKKCNYNHQTERPPRRTRSSSTPSQHRAGRSHVSRSIKLTPLSRPHKRS
jgi:hypothetical protein